MSKDFTQLEWNEVLEDDCRRIVRLAIREDLDRGYDWTTVALVPEEARGKAAVVARGEGVIAGLKAAQVVLDEMDANATFSPAVEEGAKVSQGTTVARIDGVARDLLTAERVILNLIGRLSGIATLTRQYVDAVAGTKAGIYDTRKTTPGWRRLEKHAVRYGGGRNHRTGLFDAVLIKDNHLAFQGSASTPADAVRQVRRFLAETPNDRQPAETPTARPPADTIIEVEVDSLEQLENVLPAGPDVILLDNMTPDQLRRAVAMRNASAEGNDIPLEASGGIDLTTVRSVAESGVDRISVGRLTHSAVSFDVALDWLE